MIDAVEVGASISAPCTPSVSAPAIMRAAGPHAPRLRSAPARRARDTQRKRESGAAERASYYQRKEGPASGRSEISRQPDRARAETVSTQPRCVRGTTARRPRLYPWRADGPRPRTGRSPSGKSATDFCPGDGLHHTAIKLPYAPAHLRCPRGLCVFVHLVRCRGCRATTRKGRACLSRERQCVL